MRKFRNNFFYTVVMIVFSAIIYFIYVQGKDLKPRGVVHQPVEKNQWQTFLDSISANLHHPLALLLTQIIAIILVARLFGWICKKLGQPTVMGEIVAGIVLGPSLFGMYFPGFSAELFPQASLGNLHMVSQVGLVLFMFIIGMELDLKLLKNKTKEVVIISNASIIIPFSLGMAFAYFTFEAFAPEGVIFTSFALFMGIGMSITAFPVLARILQERGLNKTRLGAVVITCAAANDITGWCLLAAVIAVVTAGSFTGAVYVIALSALYILFMLKIVKPFLRKLSEEHASRQKLDKATMALFLVVAIISACITEVIGIHALFGAFMAGVIMPNNMNFKNLVIEKIEDVTLILLLPLFFVFTGLRTQIGLLTNSHLWAMTGIIILIASAGKFLGSALAARMVGQSWKDSLSIGALMNTRGLMELIVLNIGYDLGVITPVVFTMMVIMALVTTFMTGPVLSLINHIFKNEEAPDKLVVQAKVPEPIV